MIVFCQWYFGTFHVDKTIEQLQLSIIIVNYNVKYFLEQCLASVVKACKNIEAEIIVADNDSTDGSRDFFKDRFANVTFIWLKENAGFAKANNVALKQARGEKILFLNPDTILPEDCLEKCLHFFNNQAGIGALGVRMIDGSGKYLPESKRGFPSLFTSFCKMSGLTKLFPHSKLLAPYYLGHLPENKNNEVDVLPGAFMMISKAVLDTVGSFDEVFFMYAEDIDLSYRVQKAGYKNYYLAGCTVIHFKGESTKKETAQYIQSFYGAMLLFVKKHYGQTLAGLYGAMIKTVIAVKTFFAGIKAIFGKQVVATGKNNPSGEAFVITDDTGFQHIQQILRPYFNELKRADSPEDILAKGATVILCEPGLSFKDITVLLEQHPFGFLIHAGDTKSMVGSGDKNSNGVCIAME